MFDTAFIVGYNTAYGLFEIIIDGGTKLSHLSAAETRLRLNILKDYKDIQETSVQVICMT